jgi:stalled ribosome rescue protein Dom34
MSLAHAVVLIDHHTAQVLHFDADTVNTQKIKAHTHHTKQHGSSVRTEHEFFGDVCDALKGVAQLLVAGSHGSQADFRHYVEKHRAELTSHIVAWETVDHPSEGQLLALARQYFVSRGQMAKAPTAT